MSRARVNVGHLTDQEIREQARAWETEARELLSEALDARRHGNFNKEKYKWNRAKRLQDQAQKFWEALENRTKDNRI